MSSLIQAVTHIDETLNALVFDTEGYHVVGDAEWEDIEFSVSFTYRGGNIGISPRVYEDNFFMFLLLENQGAEEEGGVTGLASLNAQETYDTTSLGQAKMNPLVPGEVYELRTHITGTNYRILLNGAVLFNMEYPRMPRGQVAAYATAGNECTGIEVKSLLPDGWTTNVAAVPGGVASVRKLPNHDHYLYLESPRAGLTSLYAEQRIYVESGKSHSVSFEYQGQGGVRIRELNGTPRASVIQNLTPSEDWTDGWVRHTVSSDCTHISVLFFVSGTEAIGVNNVQVEPKDVITPYIHNDSLVSSKIREHSVLTYPAKDNIDGAEGSLVMWFSPTHSYDATSFENSLFNGVTLFEYGEANPLSVSYTNGALELTYGGERLSHPLTLMADNWYCLVATWRAGTIQFYVDGVLLTKTGIANRPSPSTVIRLGSGTQSGYGYFDGLLDETIVLSKVLTAEEVQAAQTSVEPLTTNNAMTMRATFNYAFANFNSSIVEGTMAPNYGAPVLVEKKTGEPLRKVSFFDFYTGEYQTFNEEMCFYESPNDYVEISYPDELVDEENFKLKIEDENGVQFGAPYTLEGKKVRMSLTPDEQDDLDGQYLYVSYQLEDSYTLDFNIGVPDSFRVTLGKHDGQPVKITYEGNRFSNKKLATMVELNPLKNSNHQGFLYITKNEEAVTALRTMATPADLPANGSGHALIVIEPLDKNGNFVSHCHLDVSCEYGVLTPAYDEESIRMRERAGRFLYRYQSPILTIDQMQAFEVQDFVNVTDRETGIGSKIPITLVTLQQQLHTLAKGDTLLGLAMRYGTTRKDIAAVNDMEEDEAARYVLDNRGSTLRIPVNYAVQEAEQLPIQLRQDSMTSYLTHQVIEYFNQSVERAPAGLGALLDFNGDGRIDIEDINWLRAKRLTSALTQKYNEVVAWHQANQ